MVGLGQAAALAYVDVEGNQVVPEAHDAFLCTLNNLISNTSLRSANHDVIHVIRYCYFGCAVPFTISTILIVLFIVLPGHAH